MKKLFLFAEHITMGVVFFAMITLGAVGVHRVVQWGQLFGLSPMAVEALNVFEYAVLTLDIGLFSAFLLKSF
jgi:hypothetical protein